MTLWKKSASAATRAIPTTPTHTQLFCVKATHTDSHRDASRLNVKCKRAGTLKVIYGQSLAEILHLPGFYNLSFSVSYTISAALKGYLSQIRWFFSRLLYTI